MSAIDPVNTPSEYQQMLLRLLGADDPAEVMEITPSRWRTLVAESGRQLRTSPAKGEWSVLQLLGHAVDAELVVGARLRWILAQDRPPLVSYDQDEWVAALRHGEADPDSQLELLDALRRANLALWAATTQEQRARVGLHEERGEESFDLTFRLLAGHDRFHMAQAERALEAVGASS